MGAVRRWPSAWDATGEDSGEGRIAALAERDAADDEFTTNLHAGLSVRVSE
jgi:hypothetical protein